MGQIVEITDPGHWLNKSRGFMEVHHGGEKLGQVPLDDIVAVIVSVPGCSISTNLVDHLSRRNVPLVICGQNYMPSVFMLPTDGHNRQFTVMRAQTTLSEPKRKRAWQRIIRAKIKNQSVVLSRAGGDGRQLLSLSAKVRSGDPDNYEAHAARLYWRLLFGSSFRRDRMETGINAALNYAYAVIRACVARAVGSVGLHPSFSLHHKNPQNPLNLVDDLLEPFRPIADYVVWLNREGLSGELTPTNKEKLAEMTALHIPIGEERSPLSLAAVRMCHAIAAYYLAEEDDLVFPEIPLPLDASAI